MAQLDEKESAARIAKAESVDEMAAPVVPRPTGATKAPKAPKLRLAVEEGFELQDTPPIVSSVLQMFSPKPEGVQHVLSSFRSAALFSTRANDGDLNA